MSKFHFSSQAWTHNINRLVNQVFKLLPLYEEEGDWKAQRLTILHDLYGYNQMFKDSPKFQTTIAKLYALDIAENKMIFRKIVFEAITVLKEV